MTTEANCKRILAVDGGGSKTVCCIATLASNSSMRETDFEIIGRGQSGPSNPRSVGFEQAFANIGSAIHEAVQQTDRHNSSIAVACISLAGAGRPEEKQRVRTWAESRHIAMDIIVKDDIEPLRFAAEYEQRKATSPDKQTVSDQWSRSITLVVGTGSIALACDEKGNQARAGGWGYLLGDEGSGYTIGLSGLRSICNAHDQGIELSTFQKALLQRLDLDQASQLIGWIYQSPIPRSQIAALAEVVLASTTNDPVAGKIAEEAVSAMATDIAVVAKRLSFSGFEYALGMSGGILCHYPWLVERLLLELSNRQLRPNVSQIVNEPIHGSLVVASRRLLQ